ncbi:(2Fe-2S)-binding protein [Thermomonospora echinospora]|uniref:(2Fe-2S)-binding protein n=1 Tax=Thermomonospora echinospora TaxID=1992 RepID=UPI001F1FF0E6|nr:(2Fe-2S)-binding protein [Thermomonospora echinospora]
MREEGSGRRAVTEALADVAGLGPFFAVSTDPAEEVDPLWRPFPDGVDALIEVTAARLRTGEVRVAASTAQLGLAARLWSPVLGCALVHGVVPSLASLRYRAGAPGAVPLWLPEVSGRRVTGPDELAAAVYQSVVVEQLEGINSAVRDRTGVAAGLLWGNAASALVGTLRVLAGARPALTAPGLGLAARLLATGGLRGAGTPIGPGLGFRRRSCCLYYRVSGAGLCGDCCLDAVPVQPGG